MRLVEKIVLLFLFCLKEYENFGTNKTKITYHVDYVMLKCDYTLDFRNMCHFIDENTNEEVLCGKETPRRCLCKGDKLYNLQEKREYKLKFYMGKNEMCDFGSVKKKEIGRFDMQVKNDTFRMERKMVEGLLPLKKCSYCLKKEGSKEKCFRQARKNEEACKKLVVYELEEGVKYRLELYNEYDEMILNAGNIFAQSRYLLGYKRNDIGPVYVNETFSITPMYDSAGGKFRYTSVGVSLARREAFCSWSYWRKGKLTKVECNLERRTRYTCPCRMGYFYNLKGNSTLFFFMERAPKKMVLWKTITLPELDF